MIQYVVRRVLISAIVLILVTMMIFLMMRTIPGDQASLWVGPRPTQEQLRESSERLGLNKPVHVQYLTYLGKLMRADFGTSLHTKRAVLEELKEKFPATLELVSLAMLFTFFAGIPIGYVGAIHKGKLSDISSRLVSITGVSIPLFWLALLVQFTLSGKLAIIPIQGRISDEILLGYPFESITGMYLIDTILSANWRAFWDVVKHSVGPIFCLAFSSLPLITRMFRSSMIESLEERFVLSLQSLGVSRRTIGFKYALRTAILPTLTVGGLTFGYLLGGSFIIESIFDWPGLGKYAVESLLVKDIPAVLGVTLVFAGSYITINLLIDIAYGLIDPRTLKGDRSRSRTK